MTRVLTIFAALMLLFGSASADDAPPLTGVKNWLLLLNNDLEQATVDAIAASDHDLAVVDFLPSQPNFTEEHMRAIVERLARKPNGDRRIVIAYLNVGQAESYRRYWKKGWRVGKPNWILGTDPDGWEGNFPVAYWKPEWKALIAGEGALIDQIRNAGFDGLYLDWIGGFEDENVIARAKRDGVDPRTEMVRWVGEVAARAKIASPKLLVIAQNAATLLQDSAYLNVIDAVAHEDIWFTGADSGPEGDCPVPRTSADVNAKEFIATLNSQCRRAFRRDTANAMHFVGEEAIVPLLGLARASGKAIFTVDYAIDARNIAAAAERSRQFGFIPFVGARALTQIVPPIAANDIAPR